MTAVKLTAAALFLALTLPASAADFTQIGPQASAAVLLAARGATHEPALEFVYKIEGGSAPGIMTVDLAADFVVVRNGGGTTVYDYALRRILMFNPGHQSFANSSLYGLVDFLLAETYNRRMLSQVLAKAGAADAAMTQGPFWTQSELHVMDPKDGTPGLMRSADASGVHFALNGKEIAAYAPSSHAFTPAQGAMLEKFMDFSVLVHPLVMQDIVRGGHLPQRLSFMGLPGRKVPDSVWTLQSVATVDAAYPLTADMRPDPSNPTIAPEVTALMLDAVAGRAPGRRSVADYRAAIESSLNAGKPFEAALRAFEFNEQYDAALVQCSGDGCHTLKQVVEAAEADPRMAVLLGTLQSGGDMPAKIDALKAMRRDDLDDAYVLDEFLANDLVEDNRSGEAMPLFANAIRGNPYLGGYYKDMGDAYRFGFEPDAAWLCYDLGRALPGGAAAPVISGMTAYENGIAEKYPQFF